MNTSTTTQNTTSTQNTKGTTMTTITFEQAVYNRILTCKTWNVTRLRTVVREMWTKENAIKSETTGEFLKKFFYNFESDLRAKRFNFFDTSIVLGIYNRTWESHVAPKVDYIKEVIEAPVVERPVYQVFVYTDGSCNVSAKTGGWGVHMLVKGYPKYSKDLSGAEEGTTNNLMELKAMIEAIKSIDFTKENFVFNIITDSKYVLQTLANQEKYEKENYKKVSNPEMVKELYQAVEDKGIVFDSFTRPVMSNTSIKSGDVVHIANGGKINFLWIKGHSDNMGNDKADKLALNARKQLDKAAKKESEVITPEVIQEPSIESLVSSPVDSVPSVEVTPSDLEAVAEYNSVNSTHDFTYMMSDDSRAYKSGLKSEKALAAIEKTLSPLQVDLVALYHNHILGRAGQFGKSTTLLVDSIDEATKYFS